MVFSNVHDTFKKLRVPQAALDRSHSLRFEQASAPLQKTHHLFLFRLLTLRILRDQQLIDNSNKHITAKGNPQTQRKKDAPVSKRKQAKGMATIVKLYEGILASYEALRELGLVEADLEVSAQIETRIEWAKTQR